MPKSTRLTRRRHQLSPAQRQLNPLAHAALLLEHTMEGGIASSVAYSCIVGSFRMRQSGSQMETNNRRYSNMDTSRRDMLLASLLATLPAMVVSEAVARTTYARQVIPARKQYSHR